MLINTDIYIIVAHSAAALSEEWVYIHVCFTYNEFLRGDDDWALFVD